MASEGDRYQQSKQAEVYTMVNEHPKFNKTAAKQMKWNEKKWRGRRDNNLYGKIKALLLTEGLK